MAIDSGRLYYLFDPAFQIENNNGKPVVGGHVEVFEAGTDTKVITYQDWDGTVNPFKIPLKSDGRAVILVEIGQRYDAYAYDSFNNLVFSRLNILPLTEASINGLTKVYHDSSLNGNGTAGSPLSVANQSGLSQVATSWPVEGNGTTSDPVTVKDLRVLANDETLTAYNSTVEGKPALVLGVNEAWLNHKLDGFGGYEIVEGDDEGKPIVESPKISVIYLVPIEGGEGYKEWIYSDSEWKYIGTTSMDLSEYAKKTWVQEQGYAKEEDIPSLDGYATQTWVQDQGYLTEHQSLDGYATETWVNNQGFAHTSEIPSLDGYATEQWVEDKHYLTEHQSLDGYATQTWVNEQGFAKESDIPSLDGYATEQWVEDKHYLTEHQSLAGYATETWVNNQGFAKESDIPSLDGYATEQWVNDQGFLKEHQSLDGYATEQWVENKGYATESFVTNITNNKLDTSVFNTQIANYALKSELPDVSDMATQTWVNEQGFAKESDIPSLDGLMEESKLGYDGSGKIKSYDGVEFAGADGKSYTGVYPVEVNNTSNEISVDSMELVAGSHITINENVISVSDDFEIPTKTSDLTNDSGFITDSALTDYAKKSEIPSLDGYATQTWVENKNYQPKLTAGANITIDPDTNVISSTGGGGSGGKTYTGVAPIVVDNDINKISVNTLGLVAGSNITITDDNDKLTIAATVPDVSDMATQTWVSTNYALKSEIPTVPVIGTIEV